MSTKLTGTLTNVDFNPWPGGLGGFPNLDCTIVSPDGNTVYVSDLRNGRIGTLNVATGVAGTLTSSIPAYAGYSFWANLCWNGDYSEILVINCATMARYSVNVSTGAVTTLSNVTIEDGATITLAEAYFARADANYAFCWNARATQTGYYRYTYATGVISKTPYWKIPRYGCLPNVVNGRAYAAEGTPNVMTSGPIVSFGVSGRDRNRLRFEACTHPNLAIAGYPQAKERAASGKFGYRIAPDPDGQHIYWLDLTNKKVMVATPTNVEVLASDAGIGDNAWPIFSASQNKLVYSRNNTQLTVVS